MVREKIRRVAKGVQAEVRTIQVEVIKNLVTLVTAAFGFVAAFAWNETMKTLFLKYYGESNGFAGKFTYAIVVSVIAIIITIWLGRIGGRIASGEKRETKAGATGL